MKSEIISKLPTLPGVYIFKDVHNKIIYIGKAKNLRKRVGSYFVAQKKDWKVKSLINEHATIEHIVTQNETEALLLEAQLIRDNKPKFNVLLKSGQPFIYIMVSHSGELGKNDALEVPERNKIPELKLVRTKKNKGLYYGPFLHKRDARHVFTYLTRTFKLGLCNKKMIHGCLDYHLHKCAGICRDQFDYQAYLTRLELACKALEGSYKELEKKLMIKVEEYSNNLEYEKAHHMYGIIQNFEPLITTLKTRFHEKKYDREIIEAMSIERPRTYASQKTTQELQNILGLKALPVIIDCFDISHFQSRYIVGSCIRFIDGTPEKNKFRRFKIKTIEEQNDYAALIEIVSRRYKNSEDLPDLVLIDGGKGQLNAIEPLLNTTACVSLAKREETLFSSSLPAGGLKLDIHNNACKLLIALRDYTHHFAVRYHQLLRSKGARNL